MPSNQPIVLLREVGGDRYLPIWIGPGEATAIAFAQQGMAPARPLTHDLFKDVLEAVGQELTEVRITDLREGVFYAELVFASGVEVSARPSDAIALALRTGTPIYGSDGVLDDAGIAIPDEQEDEVEEVPRVPRPDLPRGLRHQQPVTVPSQTGRRVCAGRGSCDVSAWCDSGDSCVPCGAGDMPLTVVLGRES